MAGKSKSGPAPGQHFDGRKKGTPNKISGDVRAMILAALDKVGGEDYLVEQMTLPSKVLPMQADFSVKREVRDLSDEELLAIVAGSNEGTLRKAAVWIPSHGICAEPFSGFLGTIDRRLGFNPV